MERYISLSGIVISEKVYDILIHFWCVDVEGGGSNPFLFFPSFVEHFTKSNTEVQIKTCCLQISNYNFESILVIRILSNINSDSNRKAQPTRLKSAHINPHHIVIILFQN